MTQITFDDLPDAKSRQQIGGPNTPMSFDDLPDAQSAYDMTLDVTRARKMHKAGVPVADIRKSLAAPPAQPLRPQQPKQQTYGDYWGNIAGSALTGFNERLTGLPGDIVDASSWLARQTVAPAIDAIAGTNYADQIASSPSVGQAMRDDVANVIPRTTPTSRTAEYAKAFGQGAADASLMGMGGAMVRGGKGILGATGEFLAPKASRDVLTTLTSGGGAAAGSEFGADVGEQYGGDRGEMYGRFVGGIGGGLLGGVVPDRLLTSATKTSPRIPTNQDLRQQADDLYKKSENAGVMIKGDAVRDLADKVRTDLADFGFDPALHPGVLPVLNRLDDAVQTGQITLKGLESVRRVASKAGNPMNPSQSEALSGVISSIDDFATNLTPQMVTAGNSKEAVSALKQARDIWRRVKKSEQVDRALLMAEDRAGSTSSGGNEDNAIRQNLRRILDNPKLSRGFTKAEIADIRRVVRGGGVGQNVLRAVGKMSPMNGGLMTQMSSLGAIGGATMGSPWLAAPAVAGLIAKPIADGLTRRGFNRLSETIRSGSRAGNPRSLLSPPQIPRGVATGLLSQAVPQAGSQMAQSFAGGDVIDKVAMGLGPIPIAGDIAGVANDARNFASGKTPMTAANLGMAALGALPFVPGIAGQVAKSAAKAPEPQGIMAYHGSPHTFDKFDMSKIGAGEGNQAYGHGLYFTDTEDIARGYRDNLVPDYVTLDGVRVTPDTPNSGAIYRLAKQIGQTGGSVDSAISEAKKLAATARADAATRPGDAFLRDRAEKLEKAANDLAPFAGKKIEWRKEPGSMYQVRLNVKPDELLDWDKPLAQQPESVRKALQSATVGKKYQVPIAQETLASNVAPGRNAYYDFVDLAKTEGGNNLPELAATERLKAAGIKGIRYLDGFSRGANQGSYNYVIFDDKLIDILKRYGIPMAAGTGGAMIVMGESMPEELKAQMGGA